jgi:hypothetical protein
METHKFKIKAGLTHCDSSIEMDGVELKNVLRADLKVGDGLTKLTLVLLGEVEVEGELPEQTAIFQAAVDDGRVGDGE